MGAAASSAGPSSWVPPRAAESRALRGAARGPSRSRSAWSCTVRPGRPMWWASSPHTAARRGRAVRDPRGRLQSRLRSDMPGSAKSAGDHRRGSRSIPSPRAGRFAPPPPRSPRRREQESIHRFSAGDSGRPPRSLGHDRAGRAVRSARFPPRRASPLSGPAAPPRLPLPPAVSDKCGLADAHVLCDVLEKMRFEVPCRRRVVRSPRALGCGAHPQLSLLGGGLLGDVKEAEMPDKDLRGAPHEAAPRTAPGAPSIAVEILAHACRLTSR